MIAYSVIKKGKIKMLNSHFFVLGMFAQQPLILWDDEGLEGVIFDPGEIHHSISDFIKEKKIKIKAILNTHAHIDHIGGVEYYKSLYKVPFYLHKDESLTLEFTEMSAKIYHMPVPPLPKVDHYLKQGDQIFLGPYEIKCIETPGHTAGGVCFLVEDKLVSGDTLFAGSIGRTDLPGGSMEILKKSLEKLKKLPKETIVYPGHGPTTTIGKEIQTNPFLTS